MFRRKIPLGDTKVLWVERREKKNIEKNERMGGFITNLSVYGAPLKPKKLLHLLIKRESWKGPPEEKKTLHMLRNKQKGKNSHNEREGE